MIHIDITDFEKEEYLQLHFLSNEFFLYILINLIDIWRRIQKKNKFNVPLIVHWHFWILFQLLHLEDRHQDM